MSSAAWTSCLQQLEVELSEQDLNTWIRPLQGTAVGGVLRLLAPNQFVVDSVNRNFYARIAELADTNGINSVSLEVGGAVNTPIYETNNSAIDSTVVETKDLLPQINHNINPAFTFDSFVEGKSNQLARAASQQVSQNPGGGYNPLFLYGGVGLGKTHLMHAVGNEILRSKPDARVVYLHSERFVGDMVKALQHNAINDFKSLYRSVDALLIDDIQFFAKKDRSQEEFFHTFNALLEGQNQVILTSDRNAKEVDGLDQRLKSRFGSGLAICIDPPELETRVAILQTKADAAQTRLPSDVAFFMAKSLRTNVRELEGALKRVIANAHFSGQDITLDFARDTLRDLIVLQDRQVTIENIQKTVAEYYKIAQRDLLSKSRSRSITRPRQMAMALAKELTNHSLPEIGDAFGGRDHTTALHACRKIKELRKENYTIDEDYIKLDRKLTS